LDGRAVGQASIKALVGASYLHGRQLLYLHGVGNPSPTRIGGGARTLGSRGVPWPTHQSEPRGGRARRRLVVGIPLVGNWSEMQPTSWRLDVLSVWVLTGVLSPPRLESWS
jgi:hypothetical protein